MNVEQIYIKERAFTLIELMVTLVIAAILASLAVPSFQRTMESNGITSASERLYTSMQFTRGEAVRSGKVVTICSSADQAACGGAGDWGAGWLIFIDDDKNGAINGADQLLKVGEGVRADYGITLISVTASHFQFNSQGFAPIVGSFRVCGPSADASMARGVVVRGAGGMRPAIDTDGDGIREDHAGNGFQC